MVTEAQSLQLRATKLHPMRFELHDNVLETVGESQPRCTCKQTPPARATA